MDPKRVWKKYMDDLCVLKRDLGPAYDRQATSTSPSISTSNCCEIRVGIFQRCTNGTMISLFNRITVLLAWVRHRTFKFDEYIKMYTHTSTKFCRVLMSKSQ